MHNALKCEGPVYIEHFLVLLSVVTDINFFPSNSEEIRNAVKLQADPLLQQCSSKEKHFFMQWLFSLKTVKNQKFALYYWHPLWGIEFWTMKAFFTLVTMKCTCLMLREPDRWICHTVSTQFFTFKCGSHYFNHALLYCVSIREALHGYHKGPKNTQIMLAFSSLIHHENSLEVHNFDISLQIWSDGGLCQLHIFLQMNYALILWRNFVFAYFSNTSTNAHI